MSDVVQLVTGDSPEAVAYALMISIAICEKKTGDLRAVNGGDREWILSTYRECLMAVQGKDSKAKNKAGTVGEIPIEGF